MNENSYVYPNVFPGAKSKNKLKDYLKALEKDPYFNFIDGSKDYLDNINYRENTRKFNERTKYDLNPQIDNELTKNLVQNTNKIKVPLQKRSNSAIVSRSHSLYNHISLIDQSLNYLNKKEIKLKENRTRLQFVAKGIDKILGPSLAVDINNEKKKNARSRLISNQSYIDSSFEKQNLRNKTNSREKDIIKQNIEEIARIEKKWKEKKKTERPNSVVEKDLYDKSKTKSLLSLSSKYDIKKLADDMNWSYYPHKKNRASSSDSYYRYYCASNILMNENNSGFFDCYSTVAGVKSQNQKDDIDSMIEKEKNTLQALTEKFSGGLSETELEKTRSKDKLRLESNFVRPNPILEANTQNNNENKESIYHNISKNADIEHQETYKDAFLDSNIKIAQDEKDSINNKTGLSEMIDAIPPNVYLNNKDCNPVFEILKSSTDNQKINTVELGTQSDTLTINKYYNSNFNTISKAAMESAMDYASSVFDVSSISNCLTVSPKNKGNSYLVSQKKFKKYIDTYNNSNGKIKKISQSVPTSFMYNEIDRNNVSYISSSLITPEKKAIIEKMRKSGMNASLARNEIFTDEIEKELEQFEKMAYTNKTPEFSCLSNTNINLCKTSDKIKNQLNRQKNIKSESYITSYSKYQESLDKLIMEKDQGINKVDEDFNMFEKKYSSNMRRMIKNERSRSNSKLNTNNKDHSTVLRSSSNVARSSSKHGHINSSSRKRKINSSENPESELSDVFLDRKLNEKIKRKMGKNLTSNSKNISDSLLSRYKSETTFNESQTYNSISQSNTSVNSEILSNKEIDNYEDLKKCKLPNPKFNNISVNDSDRIINDVLANDYGQKTVDYGIDMLDESNNELQKLVKQKQDECEKETMENSLQFFTYEDAFEDVNYMNKKKLISQNSKIESLNDSVNGSSTLIDGKKHVNEIIKKNTELVNISSIIPAHVLNQEKIQENDKANKHLDSFSITDSPIKNYDTLPRSTINKTSDSVNNVEGNKLPFNNLSSFLNSSSLNFNNLNQQKQIRTPLQNILMDLNTSRSLNVPQLSRSSSNSKFKALLTSLPAGERSSSVLREYLQDDFI